MDAVRRRRLTLFDALSLVAATAVGLALIRLHHDLRSTQEVKDEAGSGIHPTAVGTTRAVLVVLRGCWYWGHKTLPLVSVLTITILVLHFRRPRSSLRRMTRQPGLVACLAATATLVAQLMDAGRNVALSIWLDGCSEPRSGINGYDFAYHQWRDMLDDPIWFTDPGLAVATTWFVLALGRRLRPERSWCDRAGRFLGFYWILLWTLAGMSRWV